MIVIFQILKLLVRLALWIFYPRTRLINGQRLRFNRPTILVSNHPNTMLDPLNTVARVKMQVFFLANSSLFNTPFKNWFFNTFFCIPIQRSQDTGGHPLNNEDSFARCDEFLAKGGCLYIAPEGGSFMERRLRKLKTGTARIAFSAENKQGFQLGLSILPMGLSYSAPNHFRSKLVIHAGEPIWISVFEKDYAADPIGATLKLTQQLTEQLRELIIDTIDEKEDELLRKLDIMLSSSQPLDDEKSFFRSKRLIKSLRAWKKSRFPEFSSFRQSVDEYFHQLDALKLSDENVAAGFATLSPKRRLILALGFPLFLFGWLNNFLPAFIPAWTAKKLKLYIGYESTVKLLCGLLTFPLFYYLQYRLAGAVFAYPFPLFYILSVVPAGWFAWWYRILLRKTAAHMRWRKLEKKEVLKLMEKRAELINIMAGESLG